MISSQQFATATLNDQRVIRPITQTAASSFGALALELNRIATLQRRDDLPLCPKPEVGGCASGTFYDPPTIDQLVEPVPVSGLIEPAHLAAARRANSWLRGFFNTSVRIENLFGLVSLTELAKRSPEIARDLRDNLRLAQQRGKAPPADVSQIPSLADIRARLQNGDVVGTPSPPSAGTASVRRRDRGITTAGLAAAAFVATPLAVALVQRLRR